VAFLAQRAVDREHCHTQIPDDVPDAFRLLEPGRRPCSEQRTGTHVITRLFSARVFTLVFCIGYAVAVYVDYPLFRYYPLARQFSLHDLVDQADCPHDASAIGPM
jgi:hypothetical protein